MPGVEGRRLKGSPLLKDIALIHHFTALVLIIATSFSLAESQPGAALAQQQAEHYLNALKFAHWPEAIDAQPPLNILLLGQGEVCDILARVIPTEKISNRALSITHLDDPGAIDKHHQLPLPLSKADAIYFCASSEPVYQQILAELEHGALTASAIPSFSSNGGMIEIRQNNQPGGLEFRINTQALKNAGVLVDSQLLKIAVIINTDTETLPRAE